MSVKFLKVKIKSLAAEAVIIRAEERRARVSRHRRRAAKSMLRNGVPIGDHGVKGKGSFRELTNREREIATRRAQPPSPEQLELHSGLRNHRVGIVRDAARSAQLAYAFLRDVPYWRVELPRSLQPNLSAVSVLVRRYGDGGWKDMTLNDVQDRIVAWMKANPATEASAA